MDTEDVKIFTEKLKREGDISPEEVGKIVSFLEENQYKLDPDSSKRDKEMADALGLWYRTVEDRLPENGNYLRTVPLAPECGKWKQYNPFCWIIKCYKKLPFPDGVRYADWANFDVPSCKNYKEFKYAGDIRLIPEIYEKIRDMKDIFNGEAYIPILSPKTAARPGYYTKYDLYHVAIIRTVVSRRLPVIYAESCKGRKLLMYPSDIDKIAFLLKYRPDDLVKWAHQERYLSNSDAQTLHNDGWIQTGRPADICDGFVFSLTETELLNKDDQDEEWLDTIRRRKMTCGWTS